MKDIRFKLLAFCSLVIVLTVLFFGLRGKDFHFFNEASWLPDEPGLSFGSYGMAYALLDFAPAKNKISDLAAFSLEIALQPAVARSDGFRLILTLHDGEDNRQLIVGQYQSYLVVMNGDDYENKRKIKRLVADVFSRPKEKLLLTIVSARAGTTLYVNGRPVQTRPDLILIIPATRALRLTLGNSVYGHSPWKGKVYGLAFYDGILETGVIENRLRAWSDTQRFPYPRDGQPFLFFPLTEKSGTRAREALSGREALRLPAWFPVLEKRYLTSPLRDFSSHKNFYSDVAFNLLGFIPLGFILCSLFKASGRRWRKNAIVLSVVLGFLISLGIETAQVWLPSRSSQALDLILNVSGAWMGALLTRPVWSQLCSKKPRS